MADEVEKLIEELRIGHERIRESAAYALGEIKDTRAVKPLITALRDKNLNVRCAAAEALRMIDPDWPRSEVAKKQVPEFITALKDEDRDVQKAAMIALGKIKDPRAVGPLITVMRDEYRNIRYAAAETLGEIGRPAVEPLIIALRDEHRGVREGAAYALGQIEDAKAVEPLISVMWDKEEYVQETAAYALDRILNANQPFLGSFPYIFCSSCLLRAKEQKVRAGILEPYKRYLYFHARKLHAEWLSYVVCRGCGSSFSLIKGIKEIIGVIGGNITDYKIDGDKVYVNLWQEETKKSRNADIDILWIVNSPNVSYDYAINSVIVTLINDPSRPRGYTKKIPVILKGNPNIPQGSMGKLRQEFREIKRI